MMRYAVACVLVAVGALLVGCTPAQYAAQADADAYRTLVQGQQAMFGQTHAFDVIYDPYRAGTDDVITVADKQLPVGSAGEPVPLTPEECLVIAFRNSRSLQTRKEDLFRTSLALANSRRGWTLPLLGGDISASASHEGIDGGAHSESGTVEVGPTLTQRFIHGGVLTLGLTADLASDLLGWKSTTLGGLLDANFTQPLLRGALRGLAYENQYRQERDFLFAVFAYERFTQSFGVDILSEYYRVLQQRDRLENDRLNIQSLQRALELTKVLVQGGQSTMVEQDQAEQRLVDARISFEQNLQNYQDRLDRFKIQLGLPVNAKVDVAYPQALKELEQAGPKDVPLNEGSAIEVALRTRPEVLTQRSEVRDAERDVEIAADAFLPQLDLIVGLSASGTEPRLPHRIRFHEYKRELGVDFNYQLDQTDNRDAYRNAVIDYDKAQRDYEQFVDNIRLDVRQSYRQLLRARRSHELSLRALEVAERQRALAALQYKAGQAPARDLLEAEADWLRSRNNVSSSLVDYTVTRLRFLADLGLISVSDAGRLAERTDPETFKRISERYPYAAK